MGLACDPYGDLPTGDRALMAWSWLALGCVGVLLAWLNVSYYRLPKAERDENERDLWIW